MDKINAGKEVMMGTFPLTQLTSGQDAVVTAIEGGHDMAQRMLMLGIRRGTPVRIVHGPGARGAVVRVGGARLALGREVLAAVRVRALNAE